MRLGNADFAIEEGSYRDIRSSRERRKGKRESTKVDGRGEVVENSVGEIGRKRSMAERKGGRGRVATAKPIFWNRDLQQAVFGESW